MYLLETENGVKFWYNGDFSGDVIVKPRPDDDHEFRVPCEALLEFAAEYIRDKRQIELENEEWRKLVS